MRRAGLLLAAALLAGPGPSAQTDPREPSFEKEVRPLLARHCAGCHGAEKPEAGLNLAVLRADDRKAWRRIYDALHAGEMPPPEKTPPPAAERERLTDWAESVLLRPPAGGGKDPGPAVIRRLNRIEYNNTVLDLFRLPRSPRVPFDPAKGMPDSIRYRHGDYGPRLLVDLPADETAHGYATIGEALAMPPFLLERYLRAAQDVVGKNADSISALWRKAPGADREKARALLADFATRAYRRPPAPDDVDRLLGLFDGAVRAGDPAESALKVPIQAILVSPRFLYKVEEDKPGDDPRGVRPLDDLELATRLSYFLWSSMPDAALLQLARDGKLRDPGALEAQARRMLRSPKASELADTFGLQWLRIDGAAAAMPNPELFPAFYEGDAAKATVVEAVLFFQTMMAEDRSVLDFVDADFLWLNAQLSKIYGMAPPAGKGTKGDWTRVPLQDKRRGGVLGLAAVLTVTSNGSRTSPVRRGRWILETLLGTTPPPPLPDAGVLVDEPTTADGLGARKKLEAHRSDPRCASCHRRIDPLGFALENYDAIGRWRERDGAAAVESDGGPAALKAALLSTHRDRFVRSLAEHLLTFALGRKSDVHDAAAVRDIVRAVERDGYRFSRLIVEVVKSRPFTHRRNREWSHD